VVSSRNLSCKKVYSLLRISSVVLITDVLNQTFLFQFQYTCLQVNDVISSCTLCIEWYVGFTTIPFRALSDHKFEANYSQLWFLCSKGTCAFLLLENHKEIIIAKNF